MTASDCNNLITSKHLEWDTKFFGVTATKHTINRSISLDDKNTIIDLLNKSILNYIFIDSRFNNNFIITNECGCTLVDIAVHLEYLKNNYEDNIDNRFNVSVINDSLIKEFLVVSSDAFIYSRFYKDLYISHAKANQLYESWLINSINDMNKMIAHINNQAFILFKVCDKDQSVDIELLAVEQKSRGIGMGLLLINNFIRYIKQTYTNYIVYVDTQVENIAAMNLYIRAGFTIKTETFVYHYWNKNYSQEVIK